MTRTVIIRDIDASLENVFDTVAHIENYRKAVKTIEKVEFLSEMKSGTGAKFRETRLTNGKEYVTELEVTEYEKNNKIRIVADSHGTVWDTIFTLETKNGSTALTLDMEARAYKLFPKLMNIILKGFIKKAVEKDMDAVKSYCEK